MAVTIEVERVGECEFSVRIDGDERRAAHRVTMRTDEYERITGQRVEPISLVKQTIELLLSRPRPKAIPAECDLTIFAIYFAQFDHARAAALPQTS